MVKAPRKSSAAKVMPMPAPAAGERDVLDSEGAGVDVELVLAEELEKEEEVAAEEGTTVRG
jgi:hypothetical protein